ncbi:MAG TPA: hypothetical protein VNN25_15080 [Thermoanaerobaculia bacterium]|nr:hypothetical protein [Thermoanaerobaculia bacterium]
MRKRISRQQSAVAEPVPVPDPVITPYEKIAEQLGAAINAAVVQIPGYNDDLSETPKNLRRRVTAKFIGMTVAAVESSPELQGVNQLDTMECRDTLQFSQGIQSLTDQLFGTARRLDLMRRVKEARAGKSALAIYNIAQRVALNPNNTHMKVHVENLRAELASPKRVQPAKPPAEADPGTPDPTAKGGGKD